MKDPKQHTKLSKFLSLVLRHKPEEIGVKLDDNGWINVSELINKMNDYGKFIDLETLKVIVDTNNKKRFAFNENKSKIRANQGHSIEVNLEYSSKIPPAILYHGTGAKYVDSIYKSGLQKKNRHHVHLSKDLETAINVGQRHGKPVVFEINTQKMLAEGFQFFESDNGVWLIDEVPVKYLQKLEDL